MLLATQTGTASPLLTSLCPRLHHSHWIITAPVIQDHHPISLGLLSNKLAPLLEDSCVIAHRTKPWQMLTGWHMNVKNLKGPRALLPTPQMGCAYTLIFCCSRYHLQLHLSLFLPLLLRICFLFLPFPFLVTFLVLPRDVFNHRYCST